MSKTRRFAGIPCGRRSKWVVLGVWVLIAVIASMLAPKLTGAEKNDAASFLPGKAESTQVLNQQAKFGDKDTLPAVIVYTRDAGITPADTARAAADAKKLAAEDYAKGKAIGPIPSKDGKALQTLLPIDASSDAPLNTEVDSIRAVTKGGDGLVSHVAGPAGQQGDASAAFEGIDGKLLYATLIVVIVILLLTYRSPFLWFIPVLSAGLSLFAAQAANYLLAEYGGLTVNGQSAGILLVLVFGAGTDYALLLVARYREELRRHEDRHEAMAAAMHRAGPAVIASAATVVIGLLCLLVAELNSTAGLGPVGAVGIICALVAMTTLLPALLVVAGRWVFWPLIPRYGTESHEVGGIWAKIGRGVSHRPRITWILTAVVLGVMSLGLLSLNIRGLTQSETFSNTPDSVVGEKVLAQHFDAGTGSPAVLIGPASKANATVSAMRGVKGVGEVGKPEIKGNLAQIQVTLTDAPDAQAAFDTVHRLRDAAPEGVRVGGNSAITADINDASSHDNKLVIPIVLLVVFGVLAILLRALLAPLLLMATVALSFCASVGISALAFRHILGFKAEDTSFILFVFVFLVALGIDYNIFLMTRIREETVSIGTRAAAVRGLAVTGGVITSAGVVLAATFSVLAVLPLVVLIEVGSAVAFGVLVDTLIVRSILVPALVVDVGSIIWWPGKLRHVHPKDEPA